jgi:hypothetical protein
MPARSVLSALSALLARAAWWRSGCRARVCADGSGRRWVWQVSAGSELVEVAGDGGRVLVSVGAGETVLVQTAVDGGHVIVVLEASAGGA